MGRGELDEVDKRYKFPVTRQISTRDVLYNMINIITTAVCYIQKPSREQILRVLTQGKKFFFSLILYPYEKMDVH